MGSQDRSCYLSDGKNIQLYLGLFSMKVSTGKEEATKHWQTTLLLVHLWPDVGAAAVSHIFLFQKIKLNKATLLIEKLKGSKNEISLLWWQETPFAVGGVFWVVTMKSSTSTNWLSPSRLISLNNKKQGALPSNGFQENLISVHAGLWWCI